MSLYGGVAIFGNTSGQTTDSTPETYDTITAGALTKSAMVTSSVTASASALQLTAQHDADYLILWSATLTGDAADYLVALHLNGSARQRSVVSLAGSDHQCAPGLDVVSCAAGDELDVRIASTSASKSVTVTDLQLIAYRLGATA